MFDDANPIAALVMLAAALFVIYIIVIATLYIVGITLAIGATFGGGVSLYNYGLAFKNNVKIESPTI